MVQGWEIWGIKFSLWLVIPLAYLIWVMCLLLLKRGVWAVVRRVVKNTKTQLDDILIESLDLPLTLLVFASGGFIFTPLAPEGTTNWGLLGFKAVVIIAIILFVDRFLNRLLKSYSTKLDVLRASGDVLQIFLRALILGLGLLVLLDSFGISITPIIASLGIGSIAIALSLQPTLESLFAGVQIAADQPVRVGDFIKLESGEEGYVYKISWRSTWIRLTNNNIVIVPNKTLVNSRVLNYHYPDTELNFAVPVGVHYDSDLDHVEKITLEVAAEVLKAMPGAVGTFQPVVRYNSFGDYSVNFNVVLRAREFSEIGLLTHEFIKRLHKRYSKEGIVIPYPVQAVDYAQEESSPAKDR